MSTRVSDLHPPKPILTFRVGVIGHRPNRLSSDILPLRLLTNRVLQAVQASVRGFQASDSNLYAAEPAVLRVASPLAEGADRLVADEGIRLGFQLHCPMPFRQEEFEQDFVAPRALVPDSLAAFRALIQCAQAGAGLARFEWDGSRRDEGAAYGAAGRIVLNHSDLVVAIWDGGPPQGPGGTLESIEEAVRFGVPVVLIRAIPPHSWRVVRTQDELTTGWDGQRGAPPSDGLGVEHAVRELVEEALRSPVTQRPYGEADSAAARNPREDYFGESKPAFNLAFPWKLFRDYFGEGRPSRPSVDVPDLERDLGDEWPPSPSGVAGWADLALRRHYAWADKLADFYADCYRSAFVAAFLLAVVAVVAALLPLTLPSSGTEGAGASGISGGLNTTLALIEPIVIGSILVLIGTSWRRRWHERWMDYRLVAELVRQLRFLLPLGGGRPFPRVPPFLLSYGDPAQTWMYWLVRAIERDVGLPNVRLDPSSLAEALREIKIVVGSQRAFHEKTGGRSNRIAHRLHYVGYSLFVTTLALCVAHLLPYASLVGVPTALLPKWPHGAWLPILCAVLPALGAALAGISNQAEFARVAKRSRAMAERLGQLDRRADELLAVGNNLRAAEVTAFAFELAQLMVDEVLDWRVVFKDRPPVLPA